MKTLPLLLGALLLAGCATPTPNASLSTNATTAPASGTAAAAPAGNASASGASACAPAGAWAPRHGNGTVTLLTYTAYGVPPSGFSDFTNLTGWKVAVVTTGDAGEALNKAILTKDQPVADVMFGVDNALIARAAGAGVFAPYASPNLSGVPDDLRAPFCVGGQMLATPLDHGYVDLNYDPAWFANRSMPLPHALKDLANRTYAPLVVTENPYTASTGLAFLLSTVAAFGDSGSYTYKDFWSDFVKNGGKVDTDWDTAYGKDFTQGYDTTGALDRPIVVSYSTSPAYNPMNGYGNATSAVLDLPLSAWHQVEAGGVLVNAKQPDGAEALLDWMLSRPFQETSAFDQVMYPTLSDAKAPDAYAQDAPVPHQPATLTTAQIEAGRDAWLQGWRGATGMS
jgi:thiamine transport system substrate-binding protein